MNSTPHPHAKKILSAEIIVSLLILLATGYAFYHNTQYTKEFAKQSKTAASPTPTVNQNTADLSYIVLVTDPEMEITMKDTVGKNVGNSYIENTVSDPTDPSFPGNPKRVLEFAKPETGIYLAEFSNTKKVNISYTANFYLYDKDANANVATYSGVLKNGKDEVKINFNKLTSSSSAIQK